MIKLSNKRRWEQNQASTKNIAFPVVRMITLYMYMSIVMKYMYSIDRCKTICRYMYMYICMNVYNKLEAFHIRYRSKDFRRNRACKEVDVRPCKTNKRLNFWRFENNKLKWMNSLTWNFGELFLKDADEPAAEQRTDLVSSEDVPVAAATQRSLTFGVQRVATCLHGSHLFCFSATASRSASGSFAKTTVLPCSFAVLMDKSWRSNIFCL